MKSDYKTTTERILYDDKNYHTLFSFVVEKTVIVTQNKYNLQ